MKNLVVAVVAAVSLSSFLIAEVSTSYYEYPLNPSVQGHKKHTSHRQASSLCSRPCAVVNTAYVYSWIMT